MTTARPLPQLDDDNRDFWTGGAQGELRIMCCNACGAFIHPPRPVCRSCRSQHVAAKPVSGVGVVDTFTINYHAWTPALAEPYVIARVRLEDAPNVILTSNVVNCLPDTVEIGDRVRVIFEQHGAIFVPLFEKAAT